MRLPTDRRSIIYLVAGILAVALLVAGAVFGLQYHDDRRTDDARTEAVAVASKQAVAMLAYTYTSADKELPKAADGLTGDFQRDYRTLIDTAIIPGAKQQQLTVQADVRATSVVAAAPDRVTVLMFLNQISSGKDTPKAIVTGTRIRMELQKVDGRWLTAALTPL